MSTDRASQDTQHGQNAVEVAVRGHELLNQPLLNKGSAFTDDERRALGLLGIIPPHQSTMEEQLQRRYTTFQQRASALDKYVHLSSLQDRNETLFYRLLQEHIAEMMPIIYTPTVGAACQATHTIFLWITDKGFARLEAIWGAWTQYALLPAFFTTVETLSLGTGRLWHPWNPRRHLPDGHSVWVWHDMYGRPRSLRPWDLAEATLRFEQPVQARSLGEGLEQMKA